jgi:hypothetical protein
LPTSSFFIDHFLCRVHFHKVVALINCCEGAGRDALIPYLDPIIERLLKLLNPTGEKTQSNPNVQEQALTMLAMVADVSEATLAKVSLYEYCCFPSMSCSPLIVFQLDNIT